MIQIKYEERIFSMKKFLEDFKKFALRGNVLDMAVGVIIGAAFTAIVTALTASFIQPLLTAFFTWEWEAWTKTIAPGFATFFAEVANFILTALILFVLLKSIYAMMEIGKKKEEAAAPTTKTCPYCKSEIPLDATRCAHCTSQLDKE